MHEDIETANDNAGYLEASPFLGFQFELTPHRLLLYCLEQATMTHVALFCQEFLQTFRPAESIGIEYVHTCDQPITRAFSGEAIFITASEVRQATNFQPWLVRQQQPTAVPKLRKTA